MGSSRVWPSTWLIEDALGASSCGWVRLELGCRRGEERSLVVRGCSARDAVQARGRGSTAPDAG